MRATGRPSFPATRAPSDDLVRLARGADVLVHCVMYPAAIDRLVGRVPNAATHDLLEI